MHTPVLLQQVIENLKINRSGKYIDATAGSGGHLKEILKRGCRVLAIEVDDFQVERLKKQALNFPNSKNLKIVNSNFSEIEDIAKKNRFYPVDGVLFDLGLSFDQLNRSGKGFSYKRKHEVLDMRLSNKYRIYATNIVNSFNINELYEIFARNSEEVNSRTIAENIVKSRSMRKIKTVGDLVEIINKSLNRYDEHVLSRIFQSLRMHVNNEINNLRKALKGSLNILVKNGRLLVITFHSIEDRVVKNFIKNSPNDIFQLALIKGGPEKQFERSAKLRVLIKK